MVSRQKRFDFGIWWSTVGSDGWKMAEIFGSRSLFERIFTQLASCVYLLYDYSEMVWLWSMLNQIRPSGGLWITSNGWWFPTIIWKTNSIDFKISIYTYRVSLDYCVNVGSGWLNFGPFVIARWLQHRFGDSLAPLRIDNYLNKKFLVSKHVENQNLTSPWM